eukprot:jgi/Ulvmu1/7111/UM034_0017.1
MPDGQGSRRPRATFPAFLTTALRLSSGLAGAYAHAYQHGDIPSHDCVHDRMLERMEAERDPQREAELEAATRRHNLPLIQARRRAMGLPPIEDPYTLTTAPPLTRAEVADDRLPARRTPAPAAQHGYSTHSMGLHSRQLAQDDDAADAPAPGDAEAGDASGGGASADGPAAAAAAAAATANLGDTHSLRFHPVYQLDEADPDFARMLQEEVMPRAMRALSRVLRLPNLEGDPPLQLLAPCASVPCPELAQTCNGALAAPPPADLFANCPSDPDCGVAADFVVFVTAQPTVNCRPTTTAHAVMCISDRDGLYGPPRRPLAGHVNFCPSAGRGAMSAEAAPRSMEAAVDTAVHELLHTLFFSRGLYRSFQRPDGAPEAISGNVITSEKVKIAVREQFDCASAEGAPLEADGGDGTAGSHWEETAFFTEIMVGVSGSEGRRVLSDVTLALAQDSGWYQPFYSGSGFLRHGHHAGCAMLGECAAVDPESRGGQNFCGSDDRCRNHDETAWCADSTLSPCPLLRPTIGGDCKLAGNLFAQFGNAGAAEQPAAIAAGIHFGPSAMCLGVPGGRFARRGVAAWRLTETCFASRCDEAGALTVLIKDADGDAFKEYPCPEGEFLVLPVEDGFEEQMEIGPCPPADEVCPYKGCPENQGKVCDGQGWCLEGTCHCAVDRAGQACATLLCDADADCPRGQACADTRECVGGDAAPTTLSSPLEFDASFADFQPLRAVRVGYMRSCVFFGDDNRDGRPSISLGERSQPSGPHGELALFLPGEERTLASPVRQLFNETDCVDTLSGRRRMALLFQTPAGLPSQDASVTVFSTAAALLLRDRDLELDAVVAQVAAAFGIDEAEVAGRDWLREVANRDAPADRWRAAAEIAAVSIAAVVAAEQVAGYASTSESDVLARDAADVFLKLLVQDANSGSGTALDRLRDPEWLQGAVTALPAAVRGEATEDAAAAPDGAAGRVSDDLTDGNEGDEGNEGDASGTDENGSSGETTEPAPVALMEQRRLRRRLRRRLADAGDGADGGDDFVTAGDGGDDVAGGGNVPEGDGGGDDDGGSADDDDGADGAVPGDENPVEAAGRDGGEAAVALADTVAMVSNAVVAAYIGKGPGELEAVLQQWAGLANVAEVDFVTAAQQLGAGDIDAANYQRFTDAQALEAGAAAHSVDLSEATKLQEEDFLSRTKEKIVAWLQREHLGLLGWAWLGMGLTLAFALCFTCCCVRARSKKPFVPPAVTNRLPQAVSARLPVAATRPGGLAPAAGKRSAPQGNSVPVYVRTAAPEDFAASGGVASTAAPAAAVAAASAADGGGRRKIEKAGSLLRGRHGHSDAVSAEEPAQYVDHDELVQDMEERQAHAAHAYSRQNTVGRGIRDTGVELARHLTRSLSRSESSARRGYKRLDDANWQSPSQPPP